MDLHTCFTAYARGTRGFRTQLCAHVAAGAMSVNAVVLKKQALPDINRERSMEKG